MLRSSCLLILILVSLLVTALPIAAQPPAPAAQPAPISFFGMNTYFTGLERIRADGRAGGDHLIAEGRALGVAWAREELSWGNIERSAKNRWDWNPFDDRLRATAAAGYGIVGMLLTTPAWARVADCNERINRFAAAGITTQDYWCPPADPADFADYVRTVVERYDGDGVNDAPGSPRVAVWQIGNEPNAWETWPGSPAEFAAMALAGYAAAKAADSTAIIAMGGLYVFDGIWDSGVGHQDGLRFLDQALAARPELWHAFDALAIHPYMPDVAPDQPGVYGLVTYWGRLTTARRWLDERSARYGGPPKPLWISEVGWSTCTPDQFDCYVGGARVAEAFAPPRVYYPRASADLRPAATLASLIGKTEAQQANYLVRAHGLALAHGVQHLSWFQLEDKFDGSAANFWEEAAILRTAAEGYARKPAANAYATLTTLLGNAQFLGFGPLHTFTYMPNALAIPARFHLRFAGTQGVLIDLVWHNSSSEQITLPLEPGRAGTLYHRDGAVLARFPAGSTVTLPVSETPLYLVQGPFAELQVAPTQASVLMHPADPPLSMQLQVRNSGIGPINWQASSAVPWLRIDTPTGSGTHTTLTLSILASELPEGSFTTTVQISSDAGEQSIPISVSVSRAVQRTYLPSIGR